jgi:hypothetical protein
VIRDMDFIRDILRKIEENPLADRRHDIPYVTPDDMGISGHTSEELVYHLELLLDVGFVDANVGMLPVMVRGLTWNGHEFLANIKNDDLWEQTKKHFSGAADVGLRIIADFAEKLVMKKFGM